jgi:hypothetical protein
MSEWWRLEKIKANDLAYRFAMFNNGKHPDAEDKPQKLSKAEILSYF